MPFTHHWAGLISSTASTERLNFEELAVILQSIPSMFWSFCSTTWGNECSFQSCFNAYLKTSSEQQTSESTNGQMDSASLQKTFGHFFLQALLFDCQSSQNYITTLPATYHIPQDWIFQSGVSNYQVKSVGTRGRVKFSLSFRGIQFKLVYILTVWFCNKHHLLASLLVVKSDKSLKGNIVKLLECLTVHLQMPMK